MCHEPGRSVIELDSSLSRGVVSGSYTLGERTACQILLLTIMAIKISLEHHVFVHFITQKTKKKQNL